MIKVHRQLAILIFFFIFYNFSILPELSFASQDRIFPSPIIISYYWPVQRETSDFYNLNMKTPNVIDILRDNFHGTKQVREYWKKKGIIQLNRVYPFRSNNIEKNIFKYFADNIRNGDGIIIDEILGNKLDYHRSSILNNVLIDIRSNFPKKIIMIWGSSTWQEANVKLLRTIQNIADIFIPEIYISEYSLRKNGFHLFDDKIEKLEKQAPGIINKIVIGIGLYSALDNQTDISFKAHLLSQVRYIRDHMHKLVIPGIALYAPIYIDQDTQKSLDIELQKFYSVN